MQKRIIIAQQNCVKRERDKASTSPNFSSLLVDEQLTSTVLRSHTHCPRPNMKQQQQQQQHHYSNPHSSHADCPLPPSFTDCSNSAQNAIGVKKKAKKARAFRFSTWLLDKCRRIATNLKKPTNQKKRAMPRKCRKEAHSNGNNKNKGGDKGLGGCRKAAADSTASAAPLQTNSQRHTEEQQYVGEQNGRNVIKRQFKSPSPPPSSSLSQQASSKDTPQSDNDVQISHHDNNYSRLYRSRQQTKRAEELRTADSVGRLSAPMRRRTSPKIAPHQQQLETILEV